MTIHRQNKMRHSSSWPDRALQKVKVRVDPLSRAFTIIPTSHEAIYRLEQTAPRSNCLEEVILLDRCAPGGVASVMIKRRLIDGRPSINKKLANFSENSSDVNNETKSIKNTNRYFMPRSLSLIETTHQNSVILLEENIVRDQSRCKSDSLVKINEARMRDMKRGSISRTTSDTDFSKLLPKNLHVEEEVKEASAQLKNKSPSFTETSAFDVIVNVANESQHTVSIVQTNNSQTRETDEMRKKYQMSSVVSPVSSTRHASSPPHVKIMEYDDYVTSMSFSSKNDLHACPKCTSEGVLRSQIDPFCSSSQSKKNDVANAHGVRRDNLIGREKKDARAEKHQSKNIWHGDRLIGEARNVEKDGKKLEQQTSRRNYDVSPTRPAMDFRKEATLRRHYYPEGGWGYVIVTCSVLVHFIGVGLQLAAPGCWHITAERKFRHPPLHSAGWLGAMSTGVALLVSPVTIAFCRRKSTRVTAVLGGLVTALGCLFTSFATQFHQLFFSYGTVVGIGVGMTRDCSTLMVAQYFKRKRELVEIFIVSGSGLGIAVMSAFIKGAITKIGWRLGLQAVTGVVFLTFILGTFYRSASLYHPQRRAILHLKNQKRKIKDKNKADKPPFFDFSTLKSKTVRILLVSTGISAFGINTPIFYLAHQAEEEGLGDTVVLLQTYLGLAWTLGCVAFGLLVVHRSVECRIARQYLTQAAVFVCGLCILALTAVQGNYHGYVIFAWIYGIFCGGYHYSLKMYTYERVRARNFARTWGFVQCSQAIPIAIGVPISGYINVGCGGKAGYYFSSTCVLVGSFTLFFIDLHRRNLSRHKHRANGKKHTCSSDSCPQRRRLSFSQELKNDGPHVAAAGAAGATAAALVLGADIVPAQGNGIDALGTDKPELTCISEEGIADMDLPDNLLEDFDYMGDCITSCNKVENYLMLSEFENNLIAEMPIIMDRRGRRWSVGRSKPNQSNCGQTSSVQSTTNEEEVKSKWRLTNVPPNSNRMITVIDEAST